MQHVTIFQNLDHAAGWLLRRVHLHHGFVFLRVERCIERVDLLYAKVLQNLRQHLVGGDHSLDQSILLAGIGTRRAGPDGTTQIVDDLQ